MPGNKVYKILKSKKISQLDKIKICLYFIDIKEIFRTYNNKKEAINKFRKTINSIQKHTKPYKANDKKKR